MINKTDILTIYSIFRDYVKHEDGLINSRMTWLITVQSFLIATFGLSYQKRFEIISEGIIKIDNEAKKYLITQVVSEYDIFLIFLAIIGLTTSIVALYSIKGAVHALKALNGIWKIFLEDNKITFPLLVKLPNIVGGGNVNAPKQGRAFPTNLPKLFIVAWSVVLLVLLVLLVKSIG
jgi:hypothetical protein